MIYYVYIITNLINGKQYVGDHSTKNLKQDYYLGTGNLIKLAIKKYGKENFKKEILEQFETKQQAFNAQEKYINEYNTLTPNGYNISPTGGMNVKDCCSDETKRKIGLSKIGNTYFKGKHHTKESKEKLKNSHIGICLSSETKEKMSKSLKGKRLRQLHTDETKEKIRQKRIGKIATKETKEKMSMSKMGEKNNMFGISLYEHWTNTLGKEIADEKMKERSIKSSNSLKGKQRTIEQIKNYISGAQKRIKTVCPYCKREFDPGNYKKYHGENCKFSKK